MNELLIEAALTYAERGWHVLPLHSPNAAGCSCKDADCKRSGKHPRTRNGLADASADPNQARRWWKQWPDANVGIRTGIESGLIVLDLDNKGDTNGEANFRALAGRHGGVPQTLTASTGRGRHLYFHHPGGRIGNQAGTIAPGVDVRGDGGYVVGVPSMHSSGAAYVWRSDDPIANVPAWLLPYLTRGRAGENGTDGMTQQRQFPPMVNEGTRNDFLYRMGCGLRGQQGMDREAIEMVLLNYNETKCNPPLPREEVMQVVESICRFPPQQAPQRSLKRQEASPLHWFPFSTRDFCADQAVQVMEDFQVGWYLRLKVSGWMNGGFLPNDRAKLWKLAGARNRRAFERESNLVLDQYEEVLVEGIPMLKHPQMAAMYADKLQDWMKKREAGLANKARRDAERTKAQVEQNRRNEEE